MQALGLIETRGLIAAIESTDAMLKAAEVTLLEKTYVGGGLVSIAVTGGVAAVKASVEAGAAAVKQIDSKLLISQHVIPRPHDELNTLILPLKQQDNKKFQAKSVGINSVMKEETTDTGIRDKTVEDIEVDNIAAKNTTAKNVTADNTKDDNTTVENTASAGSTVDNAAIDEKAIEGTDIGNTVVEDKSVDTKADNTVVEDKAVGDIAANNTEAIASAIEELPEVKENVLPDKNQDEINKEMIDKLVDDYDFEKALEVLSGLKVIKLRNLAREYTNFGIAGRTISKADKKMLLTKFKGYYMKNS